MYRKTEHHERLRTRVIARNKMINALAYFGTNNLIITCSWSIAQDLSQDHGNDRVNRFIRIDTPRLYILLWLSSVTIVVVFEK